jgi:SRSO17 transposase
MTTDELAHWAADFERFHARFARFFTRSEPREEAARYVRGLLSPAKRKNTWQMAEAVGEKGPQAMQRLLYQAGWDADAVCAELQQFVIEQFGDEAGIGVLDDTGFVKQGKHSAGVQRQWCPTLGKKENCQIGVFLTYVSPHGYTFFDRRLYLPQAWCDDPARRGAAHVPEKVAFATKPKLAQAMLEQAWGRGLPMRWVTGDERYGDSPTLRDRIAKQRLSYVLGVDANAYVFRERPAVELPTKQPRGRPRKHPRLAAGATPAEPVAQVVASWSPESWQRLTIAAGEKGPRTYDWAAARVVESRDGLPAVTLWLLARRGIAPPHELAYYFCWAPEAAPLLTLSQVAGARWTTEQCYAEGKGEAGLADYEVRYWHSWHRHVTLSMMAHAWLASLRRSERERGAGEKGIARDGCRREAAIAHTGVRMDAGRGERGRSAAAVGGRHAAATPLPRVGAGLVRLAARQAATGPPQPLPAKGRFLAAC